MGAIFRVPQARYDEAPPPRIGLVPRGGRPLEELEIGERVTFVLGAEREGLSEEAAAACDELASIPLRNEAESLNVAVAGAIALYEVSRRSLR
jgi:tRNA G18 (ribose-2'-O)-methylase SpoU